MTKMQPEFHRPSTGYIAAHNGAFRKLVCFGIEPEHAAAGRLVVTQFWIVLGILGIVGFLFSGLTCSRPRLRPGFTRAAFRGERDALKAAVGARAANWCVVRDV